MKIKIFKQESNQILYMVSYNSSEIAKIVAYKMVFHECISTAEIIKSEYYFMRTCQKETTFMRTFDHSRIFKRSCLHSEDNLYSKNTHLNPRFSGIIIDNEVIKP